MILRKILDYIFPYICIGCGKEEALLCKKCFEQIKYLDDPILFEEPFARVYIPCSYHLNPLLARAIHKMKYNFYKDISTVLSKVLIKVLIEHPVRKSTHIVPIPLHKKREKFRGFNQAQLLANNVGKALNLPVIPLLIRTRNTDSQAKLNREGRLKNLNNAFEINPDAKPIPKTTPILIIDDVCTTLSTLKESAKTLQKHGFTVIFGGALAHCQINTKK